MITPYTSRTSVTDFGLRMSNLKFGVTLAASVSANFTVPGGAPRYMALFNYDADANIWVAINETVELPNGTMKQVTSELQPDCRLVRSGDNVSFITRTGGDVGIALYALGTPN